MQTIVLRLAPGTRHNLEQISRITGVSPADLVAEAVRGYVDARVETLIAQGFLVAADDSAEEGESSDAQERWNLIV